MITPEDTANVRSKEDLAVFLALVLRDYAQHGDQWENRDLPSFIEALQRWLEDSDGYYANQNEEVGSVSPWRHIADAVAAARIYE